MRWVEARDSLPHQWRPLSFLNSHLVFFYQPLKIVIWIQVRSQPVIASSYDLVLWTITEELRGSLKVYIFLMATTRLKRHNRVMCAIGILIGHTLSKEIGFMNFLIGVMIAEFHVMQLTEPGRRSKPITKLLPRLLEMNFKIFILCLALFFGSYSTLEVFHHASWSEKMYRVLSGVYSSNTEEVGEIYLFIGTTLLLSLITQSKTAQRILSTGPLQFLGRISYSMYLLHVPLILSLGITLVFYFRWFGLSDLLSVWLMIPFLINATISISYIFTRFVDEKIIRWSHEIENQMTH